MAHFAALNDHAQLIYHFNPDFTHMKSYTRCNYLSDSGILAGNFDRSGSLSTKFCGQAFPSNKPRPHTGQSHRSCLDIRQL